MLCKITTGVENVSNWEPKNVYGQPSDALEQSMKDDAFVEDLLYNDELSFEEAAFLCGYYVDVQESFS